MLAGAAVALVGTVVLVASLDLRGDLHDVHSSAQRSASAAAELHFALADLDAQQANSLVPGHAPDNLQLQVGNRELALITAQRRRTQINALMAELGADSSKRTEMRTLLDLLSQYDAFIGLSQYPDESAVNHEAGHPPAFAVLYPGQASAVMTHDLLPGVDALARHYRDHAKDSAHRASAASTRAGVATAALGAPAVALLLWWQRDLARRYRCLVNPALLLVTVAMATVTTVGSLAFGTVSHEVDAAVADGLLPWSQLAQAKAVAAEASAAQSRFLATDPGEAVQYQAQFRALSNKLARPTGGGTGPYYQRLKNAVARRESGLSGNLTGLLIPIDERADLPGDYAEALDKYAIFQRDDQGCAPSSPGVTSMTPRSCSPRSLGTISPLTSSIST